MTICLCINSKGRTTRSFHNDITSAQRAMVLLRSLHYNEASDAKDVFAYQSDRFEGNAEADRAQVVVDLWYDWQQLFLDSEAGCFCQILGYEWLFGEHCRQVALCVQCRPLVEFFHNLRQSSAIDFLELHELQQRRIDLEESPDSSLSTMGKTEPFWIVRKAVAIVLKLLLCSR